MEDLEKMILAKRDNAFGGFVNYMESKYGGVDENEEPNNQESKKRSKPSNDNKTTKSGNKKKKMN